MVESQELNSSRGASPPPPTLEVLVRWGGQDSFVRDLDIEFTGIRQTICIHV